MKKRILSLLLAVIMILQIMPYGILTTNSEDSADESVIGWIVEFNKDTFYLYKQVGSNSQGFEKTELPEQMKILDVKSAYWGASIRYYYQLGTIDGSAHSVLDVYSWVTSTDVNLVSPPVQEPDDGLIRGEIGLVVDGDTVETLTIEEGEKTYVFTDLSDKIEGTPSYRWQMLVDPANDRWADILDYIYPYAIVSEALISNAGIEGGKATLRCIATSDQVSYVSGELDVSVVPRTPSESSLSAEPSVSTLSASPVEHISFDTMENTGTPRLMMTSTRSTDAFQIVINYKFRHANAVDKNLDGKTAANTFAVTLPPEAPFTGTVPSPPVVGYLPYVSEKDKDFIASKTTESITYDGEKYYLAEELKFSAATDETVINVYYIPQTVNFLVKIYEQNLHNDEYFLAATRIIKDKGVADGPVGEKLDEARTGFSPLYYDPNVEINGDGTTVVEIYYDRNYYLIDFELGSEEAYGVTPYYVRYNTQVMLPTPTRPGYTFTQWELVGVYNVIKSGDNVTEESVTSPAVTAQYDLKNAGQLITVQHNVDYTAGWNAAVTSYTIAYWLEDPEYVDPENSEDIDINEKYKIWGTVSKTNVKAGTVVNGPVNGEVPDEWTKFQAQAKAEVATLYNINELDYLEFVKSDQNVVVSGDGSTIVNVYYDRKEYTLKFYYARAYKNNDTWDDVTWSVCGRSNKFGNEASYYNQKDEIALLNDMESDFGNVKSQPTLKAEVKDKYDITYDESGDNRYYYIKLKVKYGADISDLYPCDVFDPVERADGNNTGNGWPDNRAIMSAWTGENHVLFSYAGGNQTMKGKFQIFNYVMLWYPNSDNKNETTVSYLCFWENANNQGTWNVPKLFRYKIWTPVLTGQNTDNLTTYIHENVTYYLRDVYDTCDNSSVKEQTQPTLKGFTANGYTEHEHIYNSDFEINGTTITQTELDEIKKMESLYQDAFVVNYFYTRNSADLSFSDQYTHPEVIKVPYEKSLSEYSIKVPRYPSSVEQGAIKFFGDLDCDNVGDGTGWYLDANCAIPFSFDTIMGINNIQLYAKWNDCYYTANVYMDSKKEQLLSTQTVVFGSSIDEPDYTEEQQGNADYKDLIFAGWYYMDGTEEKRYDFNTMALKKDMDIYAKWTSRVPVEYTVYYVIQKDGHNVEIADRTEGVSLAGISKSFTAKTNDELYEGYRIGYFPSKHSTSIVMSNHSEENVYCFVYSIPSEIKYSIVHNFVSDDLISLINSNQLTVRVDTTLTGIGLTNSAASVTVSFRNGVNEAEIEATLKKMGKEDKTAKVWEIVKQLSPDSFEQELILIVDESEGVNEAVFNWVGQDSISTYQVIHYFETLDGQYKADYSQKFVGNVGAEVTATSITRLGFQVNDNPGNGLTPNPSGTIVKVTAGEANTGLILRLYYTRERYTYTVHHYKVGTTTKLAESEEITETVPFETVVFIKDHKKTISGYEIINEVNDKNEFVSFEITEDKQEIICYYQGLNVHYRYLVDGTGGYLTVNVGEGIVNEKPPESTLLKLASEGNYFLKRWYYVVSDSTEEFEVPSEWLSPDKLTLQPTAPSAEWANKTVTIYAEVLPTSLTIQNHVTSDNLDQVFIYKITGAGVSLRVAVIDTLTVLGLPAGTYRIEAEDTWSWQYEKSSQEISVVGETSICFNPTLKSGVENIISDQAHNQTTP